MMPGTRWNHWLTMSAFTLPFSPLSVAPVRLWRDLKLLSHPHNALKSGLSSRSANCSACSCIIGPDTGRFLLLADWNHCQVRVSMSSYASPEQSLFLSLPQFSSHAVKYSDFFFSVCFVLEFYRLDIRPPESVAIFPHFSELGQLFDLASVLFVSASTLFQIDVAICM